MKNKKNNKTYTKGKSSGSGHRKSGSVNGDRPVSTNLPTRKAKLSGVKPRNMSISNIPNSRPGYAYLMEVGTSEMFNALNSGISQAWLNTARNLLLGGDKDIHEIMALYNIGDSEASKEAMTARLGLQRPMAMSTRGRNMFYNRPTKDMISQYITPFDAIVAVEEWHKEFSRSIGMKVKFMEFCIHVSRQFHEQRDHGPYGVSSEHYKANGTPFTPYEQLYYELMEQMDSPEDLNVPSHLVANLTLEDLAVYSLALLAPTSAGMVNDHWTFSAHTNIHEEGFNAGYHSLDFGLCTDNDGRPRFIVQAPTTRLADMSASDMERSVISEVGISTDKLFVKSNGKYTLDGKTLGEQPLGSFLAMLSSGVNPDEMLEAGSTFSAVIMQGLLAEEDPATIIAAAQALNEPTLPYGQAAYKPLTGSWSSWKLSSEVKSYSRDALRMMPSPATFVEQTNELDGMLDEVLSAVAGQGETITLTEELAEQLAISQLGLGWYSLTAEQKAEWIANNLGKVGDPYVTVPNIGSQLKKLVDAADNKTLQLWTLPMSEIVGWCKLVSDKLPPQYLATGYKQVTDFPVSSVLQTGPQFDMNRVTDMINLGSMFRPKFNPIKNIDANNGPFWPDADQERDWLAKPFSEGDYNEQLAALSDVFSGLSIDHGIGQGGIKLSELFAMMNPRWCDALWNFNSKSSMSKHERYVAVPANRIDASVTYATAEGDTQYSHMELLIYRLFGTFRCNTTAPISDLDYTRLGSSQSVISGGLGLNADTVPITEAMISGFKRNMYPNNTEEEALALPHYAQPIVGDDTDFTAPVDPSNPSVGGVYSSQSVYLSPTNLYIRSYPSEQVGELNVVMDWNSDIRDSEMEMAIRERETTNGITTFTTPTKKLVTDVGAILNANLRDHATGMKISNVAVTPFKDGSKEYCQTDAFVSDVTFNEEGTAGSIEVSSLAATTGTQTAGNSFFPNGLINPAAGFWSTETLDLSNITKVGTFNTAKGTSKQWEAFEKLLSDKKIHAGATGLESSGTKLSAIKAGLQGASVTMTTYTATIDEGQVIVYDKTSGPNYDLPALTDVKSKTIHFTLYSFTGRDLPDILCAAPTGASHSGVDIEVGWPHFQVEGGVASHTLADLSNWVCITSFPFIHSSDVPDGGVTYYANPPQGFVFKAELLDSGGDADIVTGPYRLPENEDIWYEQRLHELHAAILSYSDGVYYPTALSTDPNRGMYPFHRELRGFKRALIQELQEELTKLHRLSVSPFATDNKNLLRVVKSIYVQTEYMHGYTALANVAGTMFTTMSKDALLAAQDVLVRSGQIGR